MNIKFILAVIFIVISSNALSNYKGSNQNGNKGFWHTSKIDRIQLGRFNTPIGIDINDRNLIISDHQNDRIQSMNIDSGKINWVSYNKKGDVFDWKEPYYIKVDHKRKLIFISNRTRNNIGVLNFNGEKLYSIGNNFLKYPHELDIDNRGNIFIADSLNYRIVKYKDDKGKNFETINFSKLWGYPKTVSVDIDWSIAIGFSNLKSTYILLLNKKKSNPQDNENIKKYHDLAKSSKAIYSTKKYLKNIETNNRIPNLYNNYCGACHTEGNFNAPTLGNELAWKPYPTRLSTLLSSVITGKGSMMAMGGCDECNINELEELIKYMVPMNWLEKR